MAIPDKVTEYCFTPQVLTTTVVSEVVNSWPNDAERNAFFHSENLIRIQVAVAAAGMASGARFEYRADTAATLASGSQIVMGATRIITAAMLAIKKVHYLRIPPMRLPSGYDFTGLFWVPVSEAASGGFAVIAGLVDGPERIDTVE